MARAIPSPSLTTHDRSDVKTGALEAEGSGSGLTAGLSLEKALSSHRSRCGSGMYEQDFPFSCLVVSSIVHVAY